MAGGKARVPCREMRHDGRGMGHDCKDPRCRTYQMVVAVEKRDRYQAGLLAAGSFWHGGVGSGVHEAARDRQVRDAIKAKKKKLA